MTKTKWTVAALSGVALNIVVYVLVLQALHTSAAKSVPWEFLGAIVTGLGALIGVATDTREKGMPFGLNGWGIASCSVVLLGVLLTYAKGIQDKIDHDEDENQLMAAATGVDRANKTLLATKDDLDKSVADIVHRLGVSARDALAASDPATAPSGDESSSPASGSSSAPAVAPLAAGARNTTEKGATSGTTAHDLWQEGYQAYRIHDRAKARDLYTQALAKNPTYAPALNSMGRLEGDTGQADERSWYERALKSNPRYAPALLNLGIVELEAGNVDQAETFANQADQIRPGLAKALLDNIAVAKQLRQARANPLTVSLAAK